MDLTGKKIAMIIAPENFRDEEFQVPYEFFKEHNATVVVFSTRKGIAHGMLGATFNVEHDLSELNVDDFDAIVFVGGAGTPIVRSDERALNIAREAYDKGKVIGAICWSPTILAKAGILKGKKATVWLGNDPEYNTTTDKVLEMYGAEYVKAGFSVDGNIVTANGPANAENYAKAISTLLANR